MIHLSIRRRLALIAAFLFLSSFASAFAVTLLPQEQAIGDDMISNPGQGRPYMVLDPIIEAVAEASAKDMAVRNYFSETTPDGVSANYLLRQAGYQLPASWGTDPTANYVESIAAGSSSASAIWTAWMNSPPHKTHLLAENSFFAAETHYGVGYYYDPNSTYQYYWVVITAPPQPIAITTPAPPAKVTTSGVNVAGTTDSSPAPASVQFRVENASGAGAYQTATGIAKWSGTVSGLAPGPNVIRAESLDASGNVLAQTTCSLTYILQGTLTVGVSGSGSVTSALAGVTSQAVGQPLKVKASPANGYVFSGWTGSIVSGSASLAFTMQNGLNLTANFVPNPFPAVSGAYYGILTTGSGAQSGLLRLSLSGGGLFTGRIQLPGDSFSFTGAFDSDGSATVALPGGAELTLQVNLTGGSGGITGALSDGGDSYSFTLGESAYNSTANAAPQAGRYTLVLAPNPATTGSSAPQGNGYAAMVVRADGAATVAGRLADGTPYSATGHLTNNGTLAIYCVPSGAPGGSSVTGLLTFRSTTASDVDGTLAWTQGPDPRDLFYPGGFSTALPSLGSIYVRPSAALQPMASAQGTVTAGLAGGNLPQPLNVPITFSDANNAVMATPGSPDLKLKINPVSGAISGSFVLPDGKVTRGVRGVVFQKQNSGFGYFRGIDQYGSFSLVPAS